VECLKQLKRKQRVPLIRGILWTF